MDIELTTEQADEIVSAGIDFIRVLTDQLDSETGQAAWEAIGTALGNDIKGKIFFAMLTGHTGTKVTLLHPVGHRLNNKVNVIKTIRSYTGLGLKESKDISDRLENTGTETIVLTSWRDRRRCRAELAAQGVDTR